MGSCISKDSTGSKLELSDINSNIYRVVNVDDDGVALWSGQLGITRTELTLYRKGKDPTRWPLKCLRRYGYDADLFSFEAGRRCTTGEGIYAFRCRRAETLFQTLQGYIQLSTMNDGNRGSLNGPASDSLLSNFNTANNGIGPGSYILANSQSHSQQLQQFANGQLDSMEGNYLEPVPTAASQLDSVPRIHSGDDSNHLGSFGNVGEPLSPNGSVDPHSPGSPNSINNILEVTTLNPLPYNGTASNGVSNIYQEFPLRAENNNNKDVKRLSLDIPPQETAPTVSKNMITSAAAYKSGFLNNNNKRSMRVESPTTPHSLSPALSPIMNGPDGSDVSHMYMNIAPGELNATNLNNKTGFTHIDNQFAQAARKNNNNLFNKQFSNDSSHCYENLEPDDVRPFLSRSHQPRRTSKTDTNSKLDYVAAVSTSSSSIVIDRTSEPNTPTNPKFNYIVLDLDQSHSSFNINPCNGSTTRGISTAGAAASTSNAITHPNALSSANHSNLPSQTFSGMPFTGFLPPESPKKGIFDYATIDFNKTVALSNSTTPSMDCEGSRKTRHSSSINTPSHNNSVSD